MSQQQGQAFLQNLTRVRDDLPVPPAVLRELFIKVERDSSFSLDSISRIVASDQSLATRVLSRANSAYYGFEARISSISRAVNLIGLAELRRIILSINISTLSGKVRQQDLDLQAYWEHHSFTALMAHELARILKRRDADDILTIGLLHDLGKLITAIYAPDAWRHISTLAMQTNTPLFIVETEFWGIDHALVGAMTLQLWHLPETVTEPVNWHHRPEFAGKGFRDQTMILALANNIQHSMQSGSGYEPDQILHRKLGLDQTMTHDLAQDIKSGDSMHELKQLLAA